MGVGTPAVGRSRVIEGLLVIERWLQGGAGTDQISADLNALDAATDSATTAGGGARWYGAPEPGNCFPGADDAVKLPWYVRELVVPFKVLQAAGEWQGHLDALSEFVKDAFPGELIQKPNRRAQRPTYSDNLANPAKFLAWDVEY